MSRDYSAIGRAYCSERWSNRELAAAHNVTEAAIRKMAKKYGWVKGQPYQEPPPKPLPKAEPKVRRAPAPRVEVAPPPSAPLAALPSDPETELPELPILPHNPAPSADTSHLEYAEQLARRMLDELHGSTLALGEMEDLIYNETAADRDGRRRLAMLKAVSLATRAATLSSLVRSLTGAVAPAKPEKKGKKQEKQERADEVAGGKRFGSAPIPRLIRGGKE